MGLNYISEQPFAVIGTKAVTYQGDNVTLATATRTGWTLASTYQTENLTLLKPTRTFPTSGYSRLNLDVLYTEGASETSNTIELKLECSPDGVNFYRIPNESVSGGTSTLTAREFTFAGSDGAAATISLGIEIFYKFMRVSAKETGIATNAGTVYIEATLAGL